MWHKVTLKPFARLCLEIRESPASAPVGKKCKCLHGFCSDDDDNWQIIRSSTKGWGGAEQKSDVSPWSLGQSVLGAGSAGASLTHTHGVWDMGEPMERALLLPCCLQGAQVPWRFLPMFALKT